MRRCNPPYNGKRYILNTNSGEIHDLDSETTNCQIDEIQPEHIWADDSYHNCVIAAIMLCPSHKANGCYYCLRDKNNG